nr:hypothetical protein [Tanacetum cinerariifolium]
VSASGAASSHVAKRTSDPFLREPVWEFHSQGKGVMVDDAAASSSGFPTPGEMVWVESLSDDQLTAKMSVLHCMMMWHGGDLLTRYRGLNQSHHEYVLSTDSRLKGYEEKVANMTGLELQVAALKKQGLKESRRLKHGELNLVMGNRKITPVTRIGKYKLMLKSGVRINLNNCCYSSEMTRNIISFQALFEDGYQFSFDNENMDIWFIQMVVLCSKLLLTKNTFEVFKRTSQLNAVAERRNRTLLDMVQSMMCQATLPISFWGYALETATHILNIVPTKKVSKIPFEMWKGKQEKISDSTITKLNKPANYKEAMASLKAAKWKKAIKRLSQDTYLDKILKRFRMETLMKGNLPLHHGINISKDLCPKTDDELDKMSRVPYALAIGSIIKGHWTAKKNIIRYLRNTKDGFLVYGGEKEIRVTVLRKQFVSGAIIFVFCRYLLCSGFLPFLDDLNDLIIKYKIPRDLYPRLPSEDFVMFELLDDAIGFSRLCANKKSRFFLIDRRVILDALVWRHLNPAIDDLRPAAGSFNMADGADGNGMGVGFDCFGLCPWPMFLAFIVVLFFEVMGIHDFLRFLKWTSAEVQEEPYLDRILPLEPLVLRLLLRLKLPKSKRSLLLVPLRAMLLSALDSQGKGVMVDDAAASSSGVSRPRSSSRHDPSFKDVSGDAIHTYFFPFFDSLYYATYPKGGVAGNYEFTHEEWDAPYRPTFGVLT